MSNPDQPAPGTIGWIDLTVEDAESLRDFYQAVVGWQPEPLGMGGYQDYNMLPPGGGEPVAGVCHARGANADLPPAWILYIVVADLDASVDACRRHGGELIAGPRAMGGDRYCVIRDPAGAVAALYERG